MPSKVYLGDAVYVALDALGRVVITTEDGIHATNEIVLESEVLEQFERWVQARRQEVRDAAL